MSPRKLKMSKRLRVPSNKIEIELKNQGFGLIAGLDEVGRGSWAGPVVVAAVVLPQKRIYKLRDSKLLTCLERERLAQKIIKESVCCSIYFVSHWQIDNLGLHQATILAYKKAIRGLSLKTDFALIDAYRVPRLNIPHQAIIKGDMKCLSIAAASILAKVTRDNYMIELSQVCPEFGFDKNKGYPSPIHKKALKKFGPSIFHRRSFAPIKRLLK